MSTLHLLLEGESDAQEIRDARAEVDLAGALVIESGHRGVQTKTSILAPGTWREVWWVTE